MNFKVLFIFSCSLIAIHLNAQKIKGSWYIGVAPTLGNSYNTYPNDPGTEYKDSLKKLDRWRSAIGGSVLYGLELENKNKVLFGLQFQNMGFTRRREDFRFLDTLHSEIGIMSDLSQTGSNAIKFNHRYQYLSLPVLYSMQLKSKSMKKTTIHWMIGGSASVLMKYDIRAVLDGFTKNDKDVFILKNENNDPSFFNLNFQTSMRLESPLYDKNSWIFIQPGLYVPLFGANYGRERHHLYGLSLEIGCIIKPQSEKNQL